MTSISAGEQINILGILVLVLGLEEDKVGNDWSIAWDHNIWTQNSQWHQSSLHHIIDPNM